MSSLGSLVFFAQVLQSSGRFEALWQDAPLIYRSPNAPNAREVVGKAKVTAGGDNPRFIVTNLPAKAFKGDTDRERFTTVRREEQRYSRLGPI